MANAEHPLDHDQAREGRGPDSQHLGKIRIATGPVRARGSRLAFPFGVTCLITLAAAAPHALAGPVKGTLELPRGEAATAAEEDGPALFYWQEPNGFLDVRSPRLDPIREFAVVLTGGGDAATGCTYRLHGGTFLPSTMLMRAASAPQIENRDSCSHELYSEDISALTPLSTAPGNARPLPVLQPGTWTIRDRIYPHVVGYVTAIEDLSACAEVEADGRFHFGDVAAGTYNLKVFYRHRELVSREVTVEDDRELTVDPLSIDLGGTP